MSSVRYGGMQLLPSYKRRLDKRFLLWYAREFRNRRMGYGHWTAGFRTVNERNYHRVILLSVRDRADKAEVCKNEDVRVDLPAHTFGRNTGSWAIALAGMAGSTPFKLKEVPTPAQCRLFVEETAQICVHLRQPVSQLMCHHEAADNVDQGPDPPYPTPGVAPHMADPYGPLSGECLRWDIWVKIDPATLQWFRPWASERKLLWFADWWRGETVLRIQELTRHLWERSE